MKCFALLLSLIFYVGVFGVSAQVNNFNQPNALDNMSSEMSKISKSVEELNKKLANFTENFNSNQGLRLTDKQQKLLFAFEMLNRAETRLSTLQLLKNQLADREATTKRKISQIDDSLRAENIDRNLGGTTDAEQVRAARRRAFLTERADLTKLLSDVQNSLSETNTEISQTQLFLRRIRLQIFPEIDRELSDL